MKIVITGPECIGKTTLSLALAKYYDIVICDTGMLVMYIWGRVKFGSAHPEISQMLDDDTVDLYILPHWDIPFVEDPLRESNGDRDVLHRLYKKELEGRSLPFTEVKGDEEMRLKIATQSIDVLWKYKEISMNT